MTAFARASSVTTSPHAVTAAAAPTVDERRPARWPGVVAIILSALIFASLSIYLACTSESDIEADATTHYLMARYAPKEPHYFASVWGRPMCTGVYALTAHVGTVDQGRLYTRFLSLVLALVVAGLTYAVGKRQGFRQPALVWVLVLAQPLFFLHSFSELTEIPFAVVMMIAFLAYQRRQWLIMAIAVAFLPLARPEGLGFICMAAVALIAHRRVKWLVLLPIPFLAWNWAGWYLTTATPRHLSWSGLIFNNEWWRWVAQNNPYAYDSMYGHGPLLSFVGRLPVLTSPGFFPFMLVGFALAIRWIWPRRNRAHLRDAADDNGSWLLGLTHLERCEVLMALISLSILVVHSLLWWRGKMGSSGELRYLQILGPFLALMAARGWEWAWATFRWRAPLTFAGLLALAPISANFVYHIVPFPLYEEGFVSREAADWYRSDSRFEKDFPRIMPTPPQVFYYMDVSQSDGKRGIGASQESVRHPPLGTVLFWDPIYGPKNSSQELCIDQDLIEANGWIHYRQFVCVDRYIEVYLSPKTIKGEDAKSKYPRTFESLYNLEQ